MLKYTGSLILLIFFLYILSMIVFSGINYRPMPAGLCDGKLPNHKPNWVSSLVDIDNKHHVEPLPVGLLSDLAKCIKTSSPHVHIVRVKDDESLLAWRQSPVFHFTDWICIRTDGNLSSSATMGYSDFGKNRQWVETIRNTCFSR